MDEKKTDDAESTAPFAVYFTQDDGDIAVPLSELSEENLEQGGYKKRGIQKRNYTRYRAVLCVAGMGRWSKNHISKWYTRNSKNGWWTMFPTKKRVLTPD